MEYCKHGSLRDYVKKNGKLSDQCAAFILRQLVNAVKHIHSNGMMHRDLSAGNVLISSMRNGKFRVKLADFGLATLLRQGDVTGTIVGTPGYIAPQVYGRSYNQKADVFSLGGILYLMLVGKDPPREQNITKELDLGILSEEGAELIRQMMHPDENRRIILQDIRMSAFSRMADEFDFLFVGEHILDHASIWSHIEMSALADFGLATLLRQGDVTGTIVGTPGYIAPQVYGRSYNQKADVFSLGGILYLMLVGKDPPREQNITKELDLGILSEEGAELIRQMMHPDENRRIILQDIRMSAFSRMADEFDVSGNSFREGSREQIRRSSREYYQLSYAQPVRMRAHSAQPRVTSNTKPNKESGFESGDVEFANVRRQSFENTCRHSLYDGSICQRCGLRRSRERRIEGIPSTSCSPVGVHAYNGLERLGRLERRVHGSRRMLSDARMSSTRGITIGSGVSGGTANVKLWPLDISRIAPNKMIIGAGRFFFNVNGTLVYEVAGKHRSVSRECHGIDECIACIVVVETKAANGQVMSIYSTAKNTPFPHADDPPLHLDRACYKIYRSFEELQLNSSHMRFYRQIVEATKRLGGRIEKIVFKPSAATTARLMENGDFRLKFSDGLVSFPYHSVLSVGGSKERNGFDFCVRRWHFEGYTFRRFEELQLNSSHMRFYRQIVEATKRLGGRIEKIVFKPSAATTARLMENGDFRLKFSDGRLAVQKRGTDSISVSDDGTSKATLSDEEMRLFHHSRSDALEMEQLLEKGAFLCVKPFPFHFSNASLFTTAAVADKRPSDKENAQRTVVSERAVNRRPSLSKFCSEESNGRLSRKPLGTIAINSHIDDGHNVQRKSNASCGVENQQPVLETYPEVDELFLMHVCRYHCIPIFDGM
ncbi:putative serine/threonine-protein kinase zyg-1 [Toxocara canis]|uniref:Putative serine/threonine-protein kinase zyg-1 n=1 Tax=Toxocara canis TaxID=6265 RepID=A0A0B2W3G9_TOXCA|nr:putative serine/threonine-protein kinase zyg-1 [Toxocara canis]